MLLAAAVRWVQQQAKIDDAAESVVGVVAPEILVRHQAAIDHGTTEPGEDPELTTTLAVRQIRGKKGRTRRAATSSSRRVGCRSRRSAPPALSVTPARPGDPTGRHWQAEQAFQELRGPGYRDVLEVSRYTANAVTFGP